MRTFERYRHWLDTNDRWYRFDWYRFEESLAETDRGESRTSAGQQRPLRRNRYRL
jgi:hypothetical protein